MLRQRGWSKSTFYRKFDGGAARIAAILGEINEQPNVLFPVEFARRATRLRKLGVDVEVLDVKAMTKLGMGALLGVRNGGIASMLEAGQS